MSVIIKIIKFFLGHFNDYTFFTIEDVNQDWNNVHMNNAEKLLTDEEFIKWAKNPTVENDLFWSEWIKGNPDKLDDFKNARYLIQKFNYRKASTDDERFNRILKNVLLENPSKNQEQQTRKKDIFMGLETWIKVAAVFLFILTFAFIIRINLSNPEVESPIHYISKQNPFGQKSTILLPDSTVVTLNSGSRITYPETFTSEYRDVELKGEAFFKVAEIDQQPFRVKSGEIYTIALGTSFNVKAFETDSKISISLNTGKVKISGVHNQLEETLILNPGEKIIYNPILQEGEILEFDRELEFSWKDGILIFKKTKMKDFIDRIERWYGVKVELSGNSEDECKITGRFENETLKIVLESLQFSKKVEYKLNDKEVKLLIKG